ncbi:MAG: TetR/AcrR family transcriptional regulator [Pseudonocardia sp.]|nr:TetR/AcrR family transcriptional regulator [Pseudonocardia sp.]
MAGRRVTAGGSATADRISAVALRLLAVHGYAGVSMEDIRRDAEVSNGSLYHHFRTRADLVARLLVEAMTEVQDRALQHVDAPDDAEAVVRGVVRAQLEWVEHHPDRARLVYGELPDEVLLAAEPHFSSRNRAYVTAMRGWLEQQMARETLIRRPFGVAHALWAGPTQEFCRHWLHGRSRLSPSDVTDDLAAGAWAALVLR